MVLGFGKLANAKERTFERAVVLACTLPPAAYVLAKHLGGLFVYSVIGRSSSTASLVVPFAVLQAVMFGLPGFLVSMVALAIVRYRPIAALSQRTYTLVVGGPCLVAVIAGVVIGVPPILRYERANSARVVDSTGRIERVNSARAFCGTRSEATLVCGGGVSGGLAVGWATSSSIRVACTSGRVVLSRPSGEVLSATSLAELEPIYDIHALPFAGDSFDARYLALLVKLRPTSHRDVILVYDPAARLVYEEILERQGSLWTCADRAAEPAAAANIGTSASYVVKSNI